MAGSRKYMVLDGGLATEIAWTYGKQYIEADPLWSARLLSEDISIIEKVHLSYLEAGADIIETSSYQASIHGFMKHLSLNHEQAYELIVKSGLVARDVRDKFWQKQAKDKDRPLVAGSIGPYGAHLHDGSEYTGNYVDTVSTEDLASWHRAQISALVQSEVDLLAFDTIPALKEAEAIINVLREFPGVRAWISFSCKDDKHTCHGDNFQRVAEEVMKSDNLVAIGVNCLPPQYVLPLIKLVPEHIKAKYNVVVYPNSGESWHDGKWEGKKHVTPLSKYVGQWLDGGATWCGGCCRVTPKDISSIKEAMAQHLNIEK